MTKEIIRADTRLRVDIADQARFTFLIAEALSINQRLCLFKYARLKGQQKWDYGQDAFHWDTPPEQSKVSGMLGRLADTVKSALRHALLHALLHAR